MPVIPAPTGPYAVGVVDGVFGTEKVPGATYFPARDLDQSNASCVSRAYLRPSTQSKFEQAFNVSSDVFADAIVSARTNAQPLQLPTRLPVVIMAPAFGATAAIELLTSLAQGLASHGFAVIALSLSSAEPDVALSDETDSPSARATKLAPIMEMRMQTMGDVLDLISADQVPPLQGRLDASRVAVGGHSFAGWTALTMAQTDRRIAAVFNLDGGVFGKALQTPTPVPALWVNAYGLGSIRDVQVVVGPWLTAPQLITVGVINATHEDLTDLPALLRARPSLRQILSPSTLPEAALQTTTQLVVRFMRAVLGNGTTYVPSEDELVEGVPFTGTDPFNREGLCNRSYAT